jgi:hypothetical protein
MLIYCSCEQMLQLWLWLALLFADLAAQLFHVQSPERIFSVHSPEKFELETLNSEHSELGLALGECELGKFYHEQHLFARRQNH